MAATENCQVDDATSDCNRAAPLARPGLPLALVEPRADRPARVIVPYSNSANARVNRQRANARREVAPTQQQIFRCLRTRTSRQRKRLRPHRSFETQCAFVMFVLLPIPAAAMHGKIGAVSALA